MASCSKEPPVASGECDGCPVPTPAEVVLTMTVVCWKCGLAHTREFPTNLPALVAVTCECGQEHNFGFTEG